MLTLFFIVFVILYYNHRHSCAITDAEKNRKYTWDIVAWVFIILICLHGC